MIACAVITTATNMSNFKKAIKKAKQYYFEIWKGNEKPSPAFNTEIIKVTKAGWNHIVFSSRRNASEIVERLSYIKNARELIERSAFIQNYRKVGAAEYWELQGMFGKVVVRTIIRSINLGEKHIFSVFRVKQSPRQK